MGHWYLDYSLKGSSHSPGERPEDSWDVLLDSGTTGKAWAGLGKRRAARGKGGRQLTTVEIMINSTDTIPVPFSILA